MQIIGYKGMNKDVVKDNLLRILDGFSEGDVLKTDIKINIEAPDLILQQAKKQLTGEMVGCFYRYIKKYQYDHIDSLPEKRQHIESYLKKAQINKTRTIDKWKENLKALEKEEKDVEICKGICEYLKKVYNNKAYSFEYVVLEEEETGLCDELYGRMIVDPGFEVLKKLGKYKEDMKQVYFYHTLNVSEGLSNFNYNGDYKYWFAMLCHGFDGIF